MSEPDRIYIDIKDRELYDKLQEEFFPKSTRKEQFLFAMAIGFKKSERIPLETKEGFFLVKDLRKEDKALLTALAMLIEGPEILVNMEEVYKIAEEYAHAGIKLFIDEYSGPSFASFDKKLEKELFALFEKIEQEYNHEKESSSS